MNYTSIKSLAESIAQDIYERCGDSLPINRESLVLRVTDVIRHRLGAHTTHVTADTTKPVGLDGPEGPDSPTGAMAEQVGGSHYKDMKIQHADFCQANSIKWCEAAAIKYLCRHAKKNKLEDLKKALHYVRLCAKIEYNTEI